MTGDEKEVSIEDALKTVVYIQEAIINVLDKKGIVMRAEIMDEVRRLAREASAKDKH